jgi:PhnB protein
MKLDPYLFFTGNAAEAMAFYKDVFGGELTTSPKENGAGLMHADLTGGDIELMACDGDRTEPYETSPITLSLSGTDAGKIKGAFAKLAEGGTVTSALKVESWGDTFGTVTDKFGVDWMVNFTE